MVLVHGLYHRPEHFAVVAERLWSSGIDVVVPELHRGSLHADTAAVQAVIDSSHEPPVVLGHSYGGSVITGVRGAGHLIYPAAFVLETGESAAGRRTPGVAHARPGTTVPSALRPQAYSPGGTRTKPSVQQSSSSS